MSLNHEAPVDFSPGESPRHIAAAYDSVNKKVLVVYIDSTSYRRGYAVVGTISNGTITFGTPVQFSTGSASNLSVAFDPTSGKFVVASWYNKAWVLTVSGDTVTYGAAVDIQGSGNTEDPKVCATGTGVAIVYVNAGDADHPYAVAGTVSGTSITFGAPVELDTVRAADTDIAYSPDADRLLAVWTRYDFTWHHGAGRALSVSGNSLSAGATKVILDHQYGSQPCVAYDSDAQKFVAAINSNTLHTIHVVSVSGLTVSVGSTTASESSISTISPVMRYSPGDGLMYLACHDYNNWDNLTIRPIENIGGSLSYGTPEVFYDGSDYETREIGLAYDSDKGQMVVAYGLNESSQSYPGQAIVFSAAYQYFWTNFKGQHEVFQ